MIQTLFIDEHQDHEKVNDLKKRFTYAAEETQCIVDLFLSRVLTKNNGYLTTSEDFNLSLKLDDGRRSFKHAVNLFLSWVHIRNNGHSLNLDGVRRSFNLVKAELGRMKLDSSRRPQRTLNQSSAASQISSPEDRKNYWMKTRWGLMMMLG
ncbi:hypothetical protein L1987_58331 [Smallanthus sonchifolius]|uniref:Uncharacterized protein n=1 Tax=Smallanthus sonchifolius TaxID=185202 RepID=A0ACB9DEY6_9ASTR|nr:hypothetical protein L1987_58331 [Smallanthus sonchifolius]